MTTYKHVIVSPTDSDIRTLIQVVDNHLMYGACFRKNAILFLITNLIIVVGMIYLILSSTNLGFLLFALLLLGASVTAIIFAIRSLKIKVVSQTISMPSQETTYDFYEDEPLDLNLHLNYNERLTEIFSNPDDLVEMISEDIYQLALALVEKQRLLKISYMILAIGLALSISGFIISVVRHGF